METNNQSVDPNAGGTSHTDRAHVSKEKLFGLIALSLIILSLLAVGILPRLARNAALAQRVKQAQANVPVVTVVTPRWVNEGGLSLPGNVQAIMETPINALSTGYVRRMYVDIGYHVKAGQLLAEVASPDLDQQLYQAQAQTAQSRATVGQSQSTVAQEQASVVQARAMEAQAQAQLAAARHELDVQKGTLNQARAQLDLATVTNTRYQSLAAQGFVSQENADSTAAAVKTEAAVVESAQAAVQMAQADIQAAQQAVASSTAAVAAAQHTVKAGQKFVQANRNAAHANLANARHYEALRAYERVVAPFGGVITARSVDVGSMVTAGGTQISPTGSPLQTGMFAIDRTDVVRIQVNVPQTYVAAIRRGSGAQVTVREVPGRVFTGTVTLRAGALDPYSRMELVEVHLPNPDDLLVPGMYAQVHITPLHPLMTLRVPDTALIIDAHGTRVAVLTTKGTVHLQPVHIGRDFGTVMEITGGLKGDETLVDNPPDSLQEGDRVQVESTPPVSRKTQH